MPRSSRRMVHWSASLLTLVVLGLSGFQGTFAKDKDQDQAAPPSAALEPLNPAVLFETPTTADSRPSKHKIPQVPVVIDGVRQAPEKIQQFDGQPLYFVLDKQAQQEGVVYVFTTRAKVREYLETQGLMPEAGTTAVQPEHWDYNDPRSLFYRDAKYGSNSMGVPAGYAYSDLTKVYWGGWIWQDWSDEISSVRATPLSSATYLFEHENFGGSYFLIHTGDDISYLNVYGWDDKATSIAVYQ